VGHPWPEVWVGRDAPVMMAEAVFAGSRRLPRQPGGQQIRKGGQLAWVLALWIGYFGATSPLARSFSDRIPEELGAAGHLTDRYAFAQMTTPDHTQ